MGLGTILCGAGVSVFALLAALFGEGWSEYAALAGILPGLALMCFAQFRYNRGLLSNRPGRPSGGKAAARWPRRIIPPSGAS